MRLRAFRVYKPVTDVTKPTGYKFSADGTPLWVAQSPMNGYCNDATASCRNIFTVLPSGSMIAFTEANASALEPYMNTWDVAGLIRFVRTQPLGPIVSSTPAFMDPPSLDPPPDADYPGFVADHEERRTLIFVGANDGMMHAIDGRTGVEVWAFIPFNLLPKLRTLRDGQPHRRVRLLRRFVGEGRRRADRRPVAHGRRVRPGRRRHLLPGLRCHARWHRELDRARFRLGDDAAGLFQRSRPHAVTVGVPALLEVQHVDQHDGRAVRRSRRLGVGRREDRGPDLVRSGRRPDQERLRQIRDHHRVRLPAAIRGKRQHTAAASRPAGRCTS